MVLQSKEIKMIDWSTFFLFLKILGIGLIPFIVFWVIIPLIKDFTLKRYLILQKRENEKEHELKDQYDQIKPNETQETFVYHNPELSKIAKRRRITGKIFDFLDEWLTWDQFDIKSCWFQLLSFCSLLAGAVVLLSLLIFTPIEISSNYKLVEKWPTIYERYTNLEYPTYEDCKDAEKQNQNLNDMTFIKQEVKDSLPKINTAKVWAKFEDNITKEREKLND
jgi:hypothetical protein